MTMYAAPLSHAYGPKNGVYLDPDVEQELLAKYQATGCMVSLNRILLNYSDLCMQFAGRYRSKFEISDTYQDAMELLILAAKKYDSTRGLSFFTYATVDVGFGLSMRAIRKWASVTTPGSKGFFKAFRAMKRFDGEVMTHAKADAMANEIGVKIDDVFAAHAIFKTASYSLNSSIYEDGIALLDRLIAEDNPEDVVIEMDLAAKRSAALRDGLSKLDPKENQIIQERRLRETPRTLTEIGGEMGVSAERVRQIEAKALSKLKLVA
jgi:RNA polymerase sigma-32 factor